MSELDEFDKLQNKVHKLEEDQRNSELEKERLTEARADVNQQLQDIKDERESLDEQESQLKADLADQAKQLDALEKRKRTQDNSYNSLMKQLATSKTQRNKKLVAWWMNQYGNFDDMNLSQLKDWLSTAVISQRQINSDDMATATGNSSDDQAYKEHIKKVANVSEDKAKEPVVDPGDEDEQETEAKKTNKNKSQTLSDKQRIYSNQQQNNPIDTKGEAEDTEQEDSPFGHEDINQELNDYAKSSSTDDNNKHLTKEEVAEQFKKEFEL